MGSQPPRSSERRTGPDSSQCRGLKEGRTLAKPLWFPSALHRRPSQPRGDEHVIPRPAPVRQRDLPTPRCESQTVGFHGPPLMQVGR